MILRCFEVILDYSRWEAGANLAQFLGKLSENGVFVEEFALVSMFEVFGDAVPHVPR